MALRIEDYALIGDMQSAALVGRDGSIDWLCLPRFDSPACFAALLGEERHGHWLIGPAERSADQNSPRPLSTRRRYRGDTLVLETEWDTPGGTVRLIDFMPPRHKAPDVVRVVEGVSGRVPMHMELRIRFYYGKIVPWVRRIDGRVAAIAGPDAVWLRAPVDAEGHDLCHFADFTVCEGDRLAFVFTWHPSHLPPPSEIDPFCQLDETEKYWTEWVGACTYQGEWREAVVRSLITLKALTYAPTGGVVAAPTTSLPEDLGGVRNWDYRYCWLRDATMILETLMRSGFTAEAKAWREWLLRAIAGRPQDLQVMYGVAGERRLAEWELDWLGGYENSRPVRCGNAASDQRQLDVYGEVMNALHLTVEAGIEPDQDAWAMQRSLLEFLSSSWQEPDEGIWEVRGQRRHFVHSKVMAWAAFDRAVSQAERFQRTGPVDRWRTVRDQIHQEVCAKGFDSQRGTFTQYYGSRQLDAALLLIPEAGFLAPHDPRVIGTIEAVQRELMADGFVLRYPTEPGENSLDGLPGSEGAFLACSFWLADALAMIGRHKEAREMFERLLELRNDVGLLSEEYDSRYARLVGNMPQAFSHVPLVRTAWVLSGHGGLPASTHATKPNTATAGRR